MMTTRSSTASALGDFLRVVACGVGAVLASGATPPGIGPAPKWQYVEPGPGVPFDRPGFRTLPLSELDTDRHGERFSMKPLTGTGTVERRIRPADPRTGVRELRALLIGRDSAVIGLDGVEGRATAPVGEYRLDSLGLILNDPSGGEPWNYTFSTSGTPSTPSWHSLTAGDSVIIEPLRGLRMSVDLAETRDRRPGDQIGVTPRLSTADGLVINACYRGAPGGFGSDDGPSARIALIDGIGRTRATGRSGFA